MLRQAKYYRFEGQNYCLRPLVLGQIWQLGDILAGVRLPLGGVLPLLAALGSRLPHCLAVVLTPEGQNPAEKDLDALAEIFEQMPVAQAADVMSCFLALHPDMFRAVDLESEEGAAPGAEKADDFIEEFLAVLCCNDFTRREAILWGMTGDQARIWIEKCAREVLFRESVLAFLGVNKKGAPHKKRTDQDLGEFCGGEHVAECRKQFGSALEAVCATCPD